MRRCFSARGQAIEPRIGLFVGSGGDGDNFHAVAVAGQVDYFLKGIAESSPYIFGSIGTFDLSGSDTNPVSVGGDAGYRIRIGNTLTVRFDDRFTHFSDDFGSSVGFTVAIGGLLGR